jgi:hypothetical protein
MEFGNVYIKMETRNYIKYNNSIQREPIVTTNFKNELRRNINMRIKNPEVRNIYDIRQLQDEMMNVHTCVTDNNPNTKVYVRPLCQL